MGLQYFITIHGLYVGSQKAWLTRHTSERVLSAQKCENVWNILSHFYNQNLESCDPLPSSPNLCLNSKLDCSSHPLLLTCFGLLSTLSSLFLQSSSHIATRCPHLLHFPWIICTLASHLLIIQPLLPLSPCLFPFPLISSPDSLRLLPGWFQPYSLDLSEQWEVPLNRDLWKIIQLCGVLHVVFVFILWIIHGQQ